MCTFCAKETEKNMNLITIRHKYCDSCCFSLVSGVAFLFFLERIGLTFGSSDVLHNSRVQIQWFAFGFCRCSCKLNKQYKINFVKLFIKIKAKTYRKELPRERTRVLRLGVLCTVVQRKNPWFSTHFFQKFLHSLRPSKKNSTVSL